MSTGWQILAPSNVSSSCLSSPVFEAVSLATNITYCAYKMPSLQLAQLCCNYYAQPHPQDDCTFICPGATENTLGVCIAAVLGTNDRADTPRFQRGFSNVTGSSAQITCYDPEGYAYPNRTAGMFLQQTPAANQTHAAQPSRGSILNLERVQTSESGPAITSHSIPFKTLCWSALMVVLSSAMVLNG